MPVRAGRSRSARPGSEMDLSIEGRRLKPKVLAATDKAGIIAELAANLAASHGLPQTAEIALREAAMKREESLSTGMEKGIAVPHGVLVGSTECLRMAAGVVPDGVDWGTVDGSSVEIVVLFAVPEGGLKDYLRALGELMGRLADPETRRALIREAYAQNDG